MFEYKNWARCLLFGVVGENAKREALSILSRDQLHSGTIVDETKARGHGIVLLAILDSDAQFS